MKNYYTYAYLREDGTPYYIGKGSGKRAFKRNRGEIHPGKNKILILKYFDMEFDAYKHEMYMIHVLGRKDLETGLLLNRTDGGDGARQRIISDKVMNKHREVGKRCVEEKKGFHGMSDEEMKESRMKGSMASQISCARKFKVQYKDGTIYEGTNVTQFCSEMGIKQSNFTTMLNGKSQSSYGYRRC